MECQNSEVWHTIYLKRILNFKSSQGFGRVKLTQLNLLI